MASLTSSLVVSLSDRVSGPARGILHALGGLRREATGFGAAQAQSASAIAGSLKGLALMSAGYFGLTEGMSSTIGAAMKFEDAMSDIRKVIDFNTPKQFSDMRSDILAMSRQIPITAEGIAAITSAAGQANVPTAELKRFTEMTAKVSTAWDLSAGETGDALAKMKTALSLDVDQTGLLADAINHLSNASAASAPNILAFSRGLASGKLAGFAAKETLAFGAAMIGSGFEAEVAETSFRNMAKALTSGSTATRGQQQAFAKLGLNAVKVSKAMQKDAVGTTLKVFEQIGKLPVHEQSAISTMLFGSEARALPALIGNLNELRRTLGLVANDRDYAGSAAREYEQASKRTSNTLKLLKNNISAIGISLGDMALPSINQWAGELANTLSTIDQRIGVFDRLQTGAKGLLSGLGIDGAGVSFKGMLDTIFGSTASFERDTDDLGRIFARFRAIGADIRGFGTALSDAAAGVEHWLGLDPGAIASTLGTLAGFGLKLSLAAAGFSLAASSIMAMGRAVLFLSGASALIGGAKGLAVVLGAMAGFGGRAAAVAGAAGMTSTGAAAAAAAGGGGAALLRGLAARVGVLGVAAAGAWEMAKQVQTGDTAYAKGHALIPGPEDVMRWAASGPRGKYAAEASAAKAEQDKANVFGGFERRLASGQEPASVAAPLTQGAEGPQAVTLTGNPSVTIANPPPRPNINVQMSVTINEAGNVAAAADRLRDAVRDRMDGLQADTTYPGY